MSELFIVDIFFWGKKKLTKISLTKYIYPLRSVNAIIGVRGMQTLCQQEYLIVLSTGMLSVYVGG